MTKPFNHALRILLATNGLVLLSGAMLGPIYALFIEQIGGDLLDASYAFGLFAAAAGVTTLVSGRYSDTLRESKIIIAVGYGLMGIGFFSYTAVQSMTGLLLVQVVIGLGEAIYAPAFDAAFATHLDRHKEGREWGAWEAISYFTMAIGAVTGGLLVTTFGFHLMFFIMGTLCFASSLYMLHLHRNVI